jgi:hypothetical protein
LGAQRIRLTALDARVVAMRACVGVWGEQRTTATGNSDATKGAKKNKHTTKEKTRQRGQRNKKKSDGDKNYTSRKPPYFTI